jgi:hypothetical protein
MHVFEIYVGIKFVQDFEGNGDVSLRLALEKNFMIGRGLWPCRSRI